MRPSCARTAPAKKREKPPRARSPLCYDVHAADSDVTPSRLIDDPGKLIEVPMLSKPVLVLVANNKWKLWSKRRPIGFGSIGTSINAPGTSINLHRAIKRKPSGCTATIKQRRCLQSDEKHYMRQSNSEQNVPEASNSLTCLIFNHNPDSELDYDYLQ